MIDMLAAAAVVLFGLYLLGLGLTVFLRRAVVARFLLAHGRSASAHYLELTLRLVIGGAFVLRAPSMLFAEVFTVFGWVLLVTTAGLFTVPWQWHRRFAQRSVPQALRYLTLLGIASLALGSFVLFATAHGGT